MTDSSSIVRKTITRTVRTIDGDIGDDVVIRRSNTYNVYRGMSPTTSSRLELRLRELEDALEAERDGRMRAEKELNEYSFSMESVSERLDQAENVASVQGDLARKRETELMKVKKDMELIIVQSESNEASLRKRGQDMVNELNDQVELLTRSRSKIDKDKQHLILEIDSISTQLDSALKAKAHAESKWEALEDQMKKLKMAVDDLTRQNGDLNGLKARLTQENFELQRQVQDLDSVNGALSKAKSQLQMQVDDYKTKLEEETRERNQLYIQLSSLQNDFDGVNGRLEEETETSSNLRAMLGRVQVELASLRSKYDKDMIARTEELEDFKRRMNARIAELEDTAEQARVRAAKLDKEKNRLTIELRETSAELDAASASNQELAKRLKAAEALIGDLQRRNEDLNTQNSVLSGDNNRLMAELSRVKTILNELDSRCDVLTRENSSLKGALQEADDNNKGLSRQVSELTMIRVQLESERDSLASELGDIRDALKDAQARLEAASSALAQLKSDMESRLREKDNEMENIRKTSQRAIDELQRTIIEIEARYKGDLSRMKKKFLSDIREMEMRIDELVRSNGELGKQNKGLAMRVKELEVALDDEHRMCEEAKQAVTTLERRRIALTTELEECRSLLETAERARKNAENELNETSSHVSELKITIATLTTDKRRMEADISAMQADLDEALNARRSAEERADRLQAEVSRLTEDLRLESDNYRNAESLRKQLDIEIREITVRLEEAEAFAAREGKRMVAKLQARLRDLEAELEIEQRRSRECGANNRKLERALNELRVMADEDHRVRMELQEQVNTLIIRIKTLRRQLEEAEEVVTITMNKYRKSQGMIEEAEHRADMAEKTVIVTRNRGRSMSLTRNVVRVVNMSSMQSMQESAASNDVAITFWQMYNNDTRRHSAELEMYFLMLLILGAGGRGSHCDDGSLCHQDIVQLWLRWVDRIQPCRQPVTYEQCSAMYAMPRHDTNAWPPRHLSMRAVVDRWRRLSAVLTLWTNDFDRPTLAIRISRTNAICNGEDHSRLVFRRLKIPYIFQEHRRLQLRYTFMYLIACT